MGHIVEEGNRMAKTPAAPLDPKQFSIKPGDLGYDTETAAEVVPAVMRVAERTAIARDTHGTLRPNLNICPGE